MLGFGGVALDFVGRKWTSLISGRSYEESEDHCNQKYHESNCYLLHRTSFRLRIRPARVRTGAGHTELAFVVLEFRVDDDGFRTFVGEYVADDEIVIAGIGRFESDIAFCFAARRP